MRNELNSSRPLVGFGVDVQYSDAYPGTLNGLVERFRHRLSDISVVGLGNLAEASSFKEKIRTRAPDSAPSLKCRSGKPLRGQSRKARAAVGDFAPNGRRLVRRGYRHLVYRFPMTSRILLRRPWSRPSRR